MLLFWVVAGFLAAAAVGLILLRAAGAAALLADPSAAVYRRQLSELDDLAERGLIAENERASAYAEAARRLLAATDTPAEPWVQGGARVTILAVAAAAPALALGLYLLLGAPGAPDQPYASRLAAWRAADLASLRAPEIAAVLRQVTSERPTEVEGFRLLGLAEGAARNPAGAVRALRRGVALDPQRADLWQLLGEALVFEGAGKVGVEAQAAFREAVQRDSANVPARFYLAQAAAEAGRTAEAKRALESLIADMPQEDSRRADVQSALASLDGRPPASLEPAQLGAIRGMVAGLAARLKVSPEDPEGWVRLVRAYAVLGETATRDETYAAARVRYAAKPEVLQALDEAARAEALR